MQKKALILSVTRKPAQASGHGHNPDMNKPLLSVEHLVKRYGDATVVNDLSFHIEPGALHEVVGTVRDGFNHWLKADM